MMIGSVALWPKIPLLPHKWPKLNYSRNSGSKISCFSSFLRGKILDGSTESQFAAVGSIVAHFTTLGAWKYMYRATRICINFLPNSNYEATRAQSKRGTKMIESEEVYNSQTPKTRCHSITTEPLNRLWRKLYHVKAHLMLFVNKHISCLWYVYSTPETSFRCFHALRFTMKIERKGIKIFFENMSKLRESETCGSSDPGRSACTCIK